MDFQLLIIQAIRRRKPITFEYMREGQTTGLRYGHPHVLVNYPGEGLTVHLYQVDGVSEMGNLPGWRQFRLKDMQNVNMLDHVESFQPAVDYNPDSVLYYPAIEKIGTAA